MNSTGATELVQKYVQVLGIESETVVVYVALLQAGPTSALQLSKATNISRTQIYRHLEELQRHGLASSEQLSYGTLFGALPIENIEASIAAREAETNDLKHHVSTMAEALQALIGARGPQSTSRHYYGLGGLKQVTWNLTAATKEYKVFSTGRLTQHFDKEAHAFARRCRERCIERQLTGHILTNANSATAKALEPFAADRTFVRHLDPEILAINFEVYLYNDIMTLIDHSTEQLQATEIEHPALHTMMDQLFDGLWRLAEPLEIK